MVAMRSVKIRTDNYGLLLFITDMLHLNKPLPSPSPVILSSYPSISFMAFVII